MVKNILIIFINYIPMILWCVFYSKGANVTFFMLPLLLIIAVINHLFSKHIRDLLLYNVNLLISTLFGIISNAQLYFNLICRDSEGELIAGLEILLGVIYVAVLTAISLAIRVHKLRKESKTSQS